MELADILQRSQIIVKELTESLNVGRCTFEQVEQRILKFLYELGQGLEQEIVLVAPVGLLRSLSINPLPAGEARGVSAVIAALRGDSG